MKFKLEICVDSLESAINAQIAGADRVELCDSLAEGGTTPAFGTIISVRNNLTIGLNVIIRPRGSDFLYSDPEFDIMRRDIEICGEAGADGIVTGLLLSDGNIDIERTARLIEFARPMNVTFHRAFDMCRDALAGLEDIITAGADRILTSGQKNSAMDGSEAIKSLVARSEGRIIVMPGGGITGAKEFHMTARKEIESEMTYRRPGIHMSGIPGFSEYYRRVADIEKIANIINILKMI
jgi:copper homeostasis protein